MPQETNDRDVIWGDTLRYAASKAAMYRTCRVLHVGPCSSSHDRWYGEQQRSQINNKIYDKMNGEVVMKRKLSSWNTSWVVSRQEWLMILSADWRLGYKFKTQQLLSCSRIYYNSIADRRSRSILMKKKKNPGSTWCNDPPPASWRNIYFIIYTSSILRSTTSILKVLI